jgi:queuosine precursor transporter
MSPTLAAVLAMAALVALSNYAVQFPINDWLTWGAFTYPATFLVTDLTNRHLGPGPARRVAYVGFALAVLLSLWLATPRIALASGTAFLAGQLLDVAIFDRLRRRAWWLPPLASSLVSSGLDTLLFFSLAFAGEDLPWVRWALGDYAVKCAMAGAMLVPYAGLRPYLPAWGGGGPRVR